MMINVEAQSLGPEMPRDLQGISEGHLSSENLFLCLGVPHEVQNYKEMDRHIILFVDEALYFMFYFILLNFTFQCPCSAHLGENVTCYTVPLIVKIRCHLLIVTNVEIHCQGVTSAPRSLAREHGL